MDDIKITIPLEEYKRLIAIETDKKFLEKRVKKSKYDIERSFIADVFGFGLEGDGE